MKRMGTGVGSETRNCNETWVGETERRVGDFFTTRLRFCTCLQVTCWMGKVAFPECAI